MMQTKATTVIPTTAILVGIFGFYLYKKYWAVPTKWTPIGKVVKLCIFPLKSGRRIEMEQVECLQRGFKQVTHKDNMVRLFDRGFVTYDSETLEYRTGIHIPKLVLIRLAAKDLNSITFNAPGMNTFILELPNRETGKIVKIKHFKHEEIESIDCGDEISRWISKFTTGHEDVRVRLAYNDGSFERPNAEIITKTCKIPYYNNGLKNQDTGLHTDYAPLFIINQSSVDELAKRMDDHSLDINCFRPNIVVTGPYIKPFEEFNWKWIKIGDVLLKSVGECVRCPMTNINMETGERKDTALEKTLAKMSPHPKYPKSAIMGIYTKVLETGHITLGDTVYIGGYER